MMSHERRCREAVLTEQDALSWALKQYETTGRWPARRFRVVTNIAGNSYLLSRCRADSVASSFPGARVECLIPTRSAYLEAAGLGGRKLDRLAHGYGNCPRCGAAPGHACTAPGGRRRALHEVRVR